MREAANVSAASKSEQQEETGDDIFPSLFIHYTINIRRLLMTFSDKTE